MARRRYLRSRPCWLTLVTIRILWQQISKISLTFFSSVPSKVWAAGGRDSASASLFVGGYKSAVNLDFLKSENVMLIVNAAPGIQNMFPAHKASTFQSPPDCINDTSLSQDSQVPTRFQVMLTRRKWTRHCLKNNAWMHDTLQVQLERRKNDPDLSKLEETTVNWVDSPTQKLDVELVLQLVRMIGTTLRDGERDGSMLQSIQSHFTVKRCGLQKGDLGHLRALFGLDLSHLAPVSKRGDRLHV